MSTIPGPGYGPYSNPDATDDDDTGPLSPVIEITLTASLQMVDIGNGLGATTHAEVFNGGIPGPTFRLNVGDTVVVRLVNLLPYPIGIHWHGIELENYSDGTEITQSSVVTQFASPPPAPAPAGGTFLYKFTVTRAGLFWYHPHHGNSMNRVFRGLYGMIIVTDPAEAALYGGVLPADDDAHRLQLVLSDITVCKGVGSTDPTYLANYIDPTPLPAADKPEWLSGETAQTGPTPQDFCELNPKDDAGNAGAAYGAGDVPSIVRMAPPFELNRLTEGQTVLTNGVNVGGRPGTPAAPRPLPATSIKKDVLSGQGLRLRIVNCAHLRYFRLRLTRGDNGQKVDIVRIGGEGGLLDSAILEGGTFGGAGGVPTGFDSGEIVLPPATRADIVVSIPPGPGLAPGTDLTLWTRDYQRTGGSNPGNWAQLPTVPVAHFQVTGPAAATYTLASGDALRVPAGMPAVENFAVVAPGDIDDPLPVPAGKAGSPNKEIIFQTGGNPSIGGVAVPAAFMDSTPYTNAPHIGSTRYAEEAKLVELKVTNTSGAHHPFHLHGFSFQPVRITGGAGTVDPWPYREFRDTIDLFPGSTLTFRVRLDDRPLADGLTPGGALGRWLFHCHIFFHHHKGMISELVVTDAAGKEKPNVNVGGSWAYALQPAPAQRHGTFKADALAGVTVTSLLAHLAGSTTPFGTLAPTGLGTSSGTWTWTLDTTGMPDQVQYVYVTATDSNGRQDQCVFRVQIGGTDAGADIGDPHIKTVEGIRYDFQAAGEFVLLRDLEGMEIQARQTPAETPPPFHDIHTGLTECVSLNTAAAARVGSHRISYQPFRESRLQFFLDGEPADLPKQGLDLEGHRVTTYAAGGETGIRIDYAHGPVVTFTPRLWTSYGIWYLDVDVSNSNAEYGIMGRIPKGSWLPRLPSGASVGPMPASLHERHVTLYQTFADAWRVTNQTSLFMYTPWKSTASYTDRNWPPEKPPCVLKPGFQHPVTPIRKNIPIARAKRICKGVTIKDLNECCVFDVATTGDPEFAKGYLIAQELRLCGSAVQIVGDKPQSRPGETLVVTATVLPLTPGRPAPTGSVTFIVDGLPMKRATKLDKHGRACVEIARLKRGIHKIRATYSGGGKQGYHASSSPNLFHTVATKADDKRKPSDDQHGHMDHM